MLAAGAGRHYSIKLVSNSTFLILLEKLGFSQRLDGDGSAVVFLILISLEVLYFPIVQQIPEHQMTMIGYLFNA
ncbi:hypothetical protein CAI16_08440 [Virgibacillus dokdonensis]|uniref:Uncharacterized protein n=1 Tax=Virgibacillus dokdonensis TaxID=302167 RepID=A0A3E0WRB8_9BACI|nr:hypothetical protein CAI16_08440 [Virgibacillus dokdonensis]